MNVLTRAQREAIRRVFTRNPDGAPSYLAFRRRAFYHSVLGCVMVRWCDMWLGIEADGYTHS